MRPRFPRTATFRLAFVYAGAFALAALTLIVFFDWVVTDYAVRNIDGQLADEMQVLQDAARRGGEGEVLEQIQQKQAALGDRQYLYLLTAPDGRKRAGHLPASLAQPGKGEWTRPAPDASREFADETDVVRTLGARLPDGGVAVVGLSTWAYHELRELLLLASALSALVVALVAMAIAWLIGREFLTRVDRVNLAAARIMDGRFDERLPTIGMGEEFDRLAVNLNGVLERIDALMESLKQVSSDIAHDLRTPLSRLRRRLEAALLEEGSNPGRDVLAHDAVAQVDEILATFNALLRIGQVEGGAAREAFRPAAISELLERIVQAFEPFAEDQGRSLSARITPGMLVDGDEELLTQLVSNLIDNALTHGAGQIEVGLEARGDGVALSVADHGPGIAETESGKVLQRFYRLDASRSTPGAGLGLSMVAAIAQLHRARLDLDDNNPGLRVTVIFPGASERRSDIENR